jgi:4-diphosphocytidyl-2-C-methyl-D-erythritol kinase
MVFFPNAKINLGLRVLSRRADGFHDIETVFYPIPFTDAAEILVAGAAGVSLTCSGIALGGSEADNLCIKAYHLLKQDIPELPGIRMHLHKVIPAGAGLGGGSADAAFTLRALNDYFKLGLTATQLHQYALQLGSDCPFFLENIPSLATGRGEILSPVTVDLSGFTIVIVNPGIHVNTGRAFSLITPRIPEQSLGEIISAPVEQWKETLVNDFEKPVFSSYPAIGEIKSRLYAAGAVYASMSGSGSTVFALFKDALPVLYFPKEYLVRSFSKPQ